MVDAWCHNQNLVTSLSQEAASIDSIAAEALRESPLHDYCFGGRSRFSEYDELIQPISRFTSPSKLLSYRSLTNSQCSTQVGSVYQPEELENNWNPWEYYFQYKARSANGIRLIQGLKIQGFIPQPLKSKQHGIS